MWVVEIQGSNLSAQESLLVEVKRQKALKVLFETDPVSEDDPRRSSSSSFHLHLHRAVVGLFRREVMRRRPLWADLTHHAVDTVHVNDNNTNPNELHFTTSSRRNQDFCTFYKQMNEFSFNLIYVFSFWRPRLKLFSSPNYYRLGVKHSDPNRKMTKLLTLKTKYH